jgi:hypothetical protein
LLRLEDCAYSTPSRFDSSANLCTLRAESHHRAPRSRRRERTCARLPRRAWASLCTRWTDRRRNLRSRRVRWETIHSSEFQNANAVCASDKSGRPASPELLNWGLGGSTVRVVKSLTSGVTEGFFGQLGAAWRRIPRGGRQSG